MDPSDKSAQAGDTRERERQRAVDRSGILTGRFGPQLQRIVDQAITVFKVPMALITVIDRERQWFAARAGIEALETSRAVSFCAHAILRPGEPMVVTDAQRDPRFSANPVVTGDPHVRFYAGMPLIDRLGYPLGALCVIDTKPRARPENLEDLRGLAREAERELAR